MDRNFGALSRLISFQQKWTDKHDCRLHRNQPIHLDVGDHRGLRLQQSVHPSQRLFLRRVHALHELTQEFLARPIGVETRRVYEVSACLAVGFIDFLRFRLG